MKNRNEKDEIPHNASRFSVTQVPDFSFSDGTNIDAIRPKKGGRQKAKMIIENTKPEL